MRQPKLLPISPDTHPAWHKLPYSRSTKYRHAGIATHLYTHAIQHMDAKFIVVPYAVVEKDIDYWKQLGFRSFGIHGHKDSGVDVDLVRLSTLPQKPFTPEQHELTLAEIKKLQYILKSGCYAVNYV